jgi:large subunit ribosomal protein L23
MSKMINVNYYDIIRRPIITEKSAIGAQLNKFFFEVSSCSDKIKIKKAIEAIFGVNVVRVNISNSHGKRKFFRGREGFRSGYKKAIVTLEQGQTINFTAKGV